MIDELSIIIPTLNEEKYLPTLLASIAKQQFRGRLQVIVVDGCSDDKTVDEAKKFAPLISNLLVLTTHKGVAHQRNHGVTYAKYAYLLFLDADALLPDQFLQQFTQKIDPHVQCVDFIFMVSTHKNVFDLLFVMWMFAILSVMQHVDPMTFGSFLFTTKSIHKRIGGFDEKAVIGEDIDYGKRAIASGAKYHLHYRPHILMSPRREYRHGRINTFLMWAKMYFYMNRTKKPVYDPALFRYPFGEYKESV